MSVQQRTNVELAFEILKDKLESSSVAKNLNKLGFWNVEVRFGEIFSEAFSQILSLLISDSFFRFEALDNFSGGSGGQSTPVILFTPSVTKSDTERFRIILLLGKGGKNFLKSADGAVETINVSGSDGEQEYSFFWNSGKMEISSEEKESSNVHSQLTRPDIFPPHSRQNVPIPLWKIAFTSEAQYSATPARANEAMVADIIQKLEESGFNKSGVSFLDGTANCGADVINSVFVSNNLKHPFRISAIEMDPLNYRALEENVSLFGCEAEVETIQADVVKWLSNEGKMRKFDCMYFDPPWGGRSYKTEEKVQLELSGINIWTLCRQIMKEYKPRLIVVKGPTNWDMNHPDLSEIKQFVKFKTFQQARNIVYAYIEIWKF
jgi:16S rRNA G966 N2-methylase RsmD